VTVRDEDFPTAQPDEYMQRIFKSDKLYLFKKCLDRYLVMLQAKSAKGNTEINNEILLLKRIKIIIRDSIKKAGGSSADLTMSFGDYQLLADILWKCWAADRTILNEKKKTISIQGELEHEEAELERLKGIIELPIFQKIPRRPLLVENLLPDNHKLEVPQKKPLSATNQFSFHGHVGSVVGQNYSKVLSKREIRKVDKSRPWWENPWLLIVVGTIIAGLILAYGFGVGK
jgi:hypothetical protein